MATQLEGSSTEGDGGVKRVLVSPTGRLSTLAATQEASLVGALNASAYNLNTGVISSITAANSALFYYKHNEDQALVIESFVIGLNDAATSDVQTIKVIANPTAGTIISGASAGDINANRDFDSGNTLSNSLFYKGASGNTFTDGADYIIAYMPDAQRNVLPINTVIRKGNSVGVTLSPALSSGSISAYVAMVCHLATL